MKRSELRSRAFANARLSATIGVALFAAMLVTATALMKGRSEPKKTSVSDLLVTAESDKEALLKPGGKRADKGRRGEPGAAKTNVGQTGETVVLPMQYYGVSGTLSDLARQNLPTVSKENGMRQEDEMEKLFEAPEAVRNENVRPATTQTEPVAPRALVPGTSFEGPGLGMSGFAIAGAPPDTTLAVGPNHIVAWANTQYAVFDKSGNKLLPGNGFVNGNSLFTGLGNVCETTNRGDPILQYDRLADRWFLSQFGFNVDGSGNPIAPYLQCIAVSTTNSPLGTYFRYTISFSSVSPSGLNDYGKLGVWPDAYYTSYNIFGGSPAGSNTGAALCASDRTKMLAGDGTATTLCAPINFYGGGAAFLPADLDGTTLPTDTTQGGIFMRQSTAPALRILKLKPNFAASTVTLTDGFGGALGSFVEIPLPTTTRACNGSGGTCVAQPATANLLDTLGDRLMYRLAYRNRGGVDSLVVAQSVDPDGAGARSSAMRWYEIRSPFSATPTLFQSATYDPGASGDRWMGSIAMDQFGNMLLGYSVVNAGTGLKPSIAVAGRLLGDPVNTLQAETTVFTGTGSQTGTLHRWGDYTTMQIDPSDDATFWFIGQYLAADGTFNWHTRISSYRFAAGTIYTWNQTASAAWTTATNWTPTRTTPAASDILLFNNGATTTATGVPTETIAQLVVTGNTNVTLQAGAANTLTIAGDAGPDLSVTLGSQLNVNTATALIINVASGATGSISGSMDYAAGAHRLTAADASGITFQSGATFTADTGFTGNAFGTTNNSSVVFASGSTYVCKAGSNPFGASAPGTAVVFQTGSLFSLQGNLTPSFAGRTYANFEQNTASTITVIGGTAVVMDNLTITLGTLNFNMTATPGHSIKGNISVTGTLNFNPASPGTVNLNGSSTQTISGAGTLTFSSLHTLNLANANGLTLQRNVTIANNLNFTAGIVTTGTNTLTLGSSAFISGAGATSYVIGNLDRTYSATGGKAFDVGTANGYSPVNANATAGTFPTDLTIKATQGPQPNVNASTSIQRYWTLTGANLTANITFQYNAGDVMGTEANYKVIRISGGNPVAFPSSTVNPGAHTATLNGVSSFSDWTVGENVGPSAANGNIGGTITDTSGAPVSGVTISLSGSESREAITDSSGNYSFDNVETNGFYTVTPARANHTFSPANRSFSLLGVRTEASFTANANGDRANAIDTSEFFVRQHYLDFLSREPDPPGFIGWVNTLRNCTAGDASCDRVHVSESFYRSQEFQERGYFAYRFYATALGRKPDYAEFGPDLARVSGFLTNDQLEAARTAFVNDFMTRPAFAAQYNRLSNSAYVDALLNTAGVNLSNRQATIDSLNSGTATRAQVLRQIAESGEVYQRFYNQAFVVMEYFGYLRRDPDALYLDWVRALDANPADSRRMVDGFVNSAEYRNRFAQ